MKPRIAFMATLCALALPLWAEVRVLSVEVEPDRYVTGQAVLVRLFWDDQGVSWEPAELSFEGGGDSLEPTVLKARLARKAGRPVLELVVIPWQPGLSKVPPMELSGLSFPAVELDTASALEGLSAFTPALRGQKEPPGLRARVYLAVAVGLSLVVLLLALVRYLPPWMKLGAARRELKVARRSLLKVLDGLSSRRPEGGAASWRELCLALRAYVSAVLGRSILALTPAELESQATLAASRDDAMPTPSDAPATVKALSASAAILREGDRARFALDASASLERAARWSRELVGSLDELLADRSRRGRAHVV